MALGLGPILAQERRASARRWQTYAVRVLCAASLLVGLTFIWAVHVAGKPQGPVRWQPEAGRWYFYATVGVQLALVLIAAPAYAAGSICEDRVRGTLAHMLVTDLSAAEIVLQKLAARLAAVLGLVACAGPVAYLVSWLGGLDPRALAWAFAVAAAVGVLGCTLALTLSIWARTPHEALLGVYATWVFVLLVRPAWQALYLGGALASASAPWVRRMDPFWLSFAPYLDPDNVGPADYVAFLAVALGLSAALVIVAIPRLRAATLAQAAVPSPRRGCPARLGFSGRLLRALPGPSLDRNPVLWREWHRNRLTGRVRVFWWMYVAALSAAAGTCMVGTLRDGVGPGPDLAGALTLLLFAVGLLMLSARATASLSEERLRGTLNLLLATPLPTREIVWGKWWGAFRAFPLLAIWPAALVAALAFGWRRPYSFPAGSALTTFAQPGLPAGLFAVALMVAYVLAHGAMITSLGLALATWIPRQGFAAALCATYFVAVCLGWPALCFVLLDSPWPDQTATCAALLSPFLGFAHLADHASCPGIGSEPIVRWLTCWTVLLVLAATALLAATLRSFDRCLGRVSAREERPDGRPSDLAAVAPAAGG